MIHHPHLKMVNWQEGMSISSNHFTQTEDFFIEMIRDHASLNLTNANYGLLPAGNEEDDMNGISITDHASGHIEIKLIRCNAITASGLRVGFNPENADYLIKTYSLDAISAKNTQKEVTQWDVIVIVDPFRRNPVGELDPQETPPRHPDVSSYLDLQVVPYGEINTWDFGTHHLTIGRIRKNGDRFEVNSNYIPPCTTMLSHPDLMQYYNTFGQHLSSIEKSAKAIVAKIVSKQQQTELSENIRAICQEMMFYVSRIYFDYRNTGKYLPPIKIVSYFSSFAHTVLTGLSCMKSNDKELVLKYFYEWSDVSPGSFEEMLASMAELIYEHDKIRSMMIMVENFVSVMSELWKKLGELDYIGQRKENIVVSERFQQTESRSKSKSKWSILD